MLLPQLVKCFMFAVLSDVEVLQILTEEVGSTFKVRCVPDKIVLAKRAIESGFGEFLEVFKAGLDITYFAFDNDTIDVTFIEVSKEVLDANKLDPNTIKMINLMIILHN